MGFTESNINCHSVKSWERSIKHLCFVKKNIIYMLLWPPWKAILTVIVTNCNCNLITTTTTVQYTNTMSYYMSVWFWLNKTKHNQNDAPAVWSCDTHKIIVFEKNRPYFIVTKYLQYFLICVSNMEVRIRDAHL